MMNSIVNENLVSFFARPLALICGGAKAAGNAMTYAVLYIKTASGMVLFFGLGSIFQCVLACYGYQREDVMQCHQYCE